MLKNNNNKTNKKVVAVLTFCSFTVFTAITVYLLSPIVRTNAANIDTISGTQNVEFHMPGTMSLALSNNSLTYTMLPTSEGTFESKSVVAQVSSNSMAGFQLYLSSNTEKSDLTYKKVSDVISSSFNTAVTSSTMQNNTWGYSLDGTNYNSVPGLLSPTIIRNIDHFTTDSSDLNSSIAFGVKIDDTLAAGTYNGVVRVTLVSQPTGEETPEFDFDTFSEIRYMHQMTPAICAAETTPDASAHEHTYYHTDETNVVPTSYLRDIRDGTFYLVAKLADGNCWMIQDLTLDLGYSKKYTNEYTDLNTKPSFRTDGNNDRSGYEWTDTNAKVTRYYQNSYNNFVENPVGNEYNMYGSYYYNWYAATAGNKVSSNESVISNDSICPRGWKLPLGTGEKSFMGLVNTYIDYYEDYNGYFNGNMLQDAPLYFRANGSFYSYTGGDWYSNGTNDYEYMEYWTAESMTNAQANFIEDNDKETHQTGAAKIFYSEPYEGEEYTRIYDDPMYDGHSASEQKDYRLWKHAGHAVRCVAR